MKDGEDEDKDQPRPDEGDKKEDGFEMKIDLMVKWRILLNRDRKIKNILGQMRQKNSFLGFKKKGKMSWMSYYVLNRMSYLRTPRMMKKVGTTENRNQQIWLPPRIMMMFRMEKIVPMKT